MTTQQLFPKPAKRMKQPPKDLLREQLATAADEIIRLRAQALANEDRIKSARAALEGEQHG
ncbi:hypothetical protein ATCM_02865 [Stenotrophomonas sp. ATCM1_4]|uniref:hypothetical protein n=1 Tax=Stenotrophomonas sp. ATCM1_4 TaxID=2259330 RepID=UPI00104717BA|nr:hypothetical protein [Stenotrophomonas sp. ATCM1_4]TDB26679.1 hypothetical protein ATCM_02865 [Stenotrophomonas sp. ATCM1_4]